MGAVTLASELSAPQVAVAQCAALLGVLALLYVPLGDAMARLFSREHHLAPERWIYRLFGVRADQDQSWTGYARSLLTFSAVCVLLLYAMQRAQALLPLSLGHEPVAEGVAFNTAASFVTNTNWQAYAPESTMGHAVQAAGLAVQNFVSAAVGIAVAVALIRGMARRRSAGIGNFWVDMTRACLGLLLPLAAVSALVLVAGGVIQNWHGFDVLRGLTGAPVTVPGGPVASQEAIKNLGTNGGGFFNANGSHPFENPQPWTSFLQCLLILAIPFSLPRTFGTMVGDRRQGHAVAAVMGLIFVASYALLAWLESLGRGTAPQLAGAALEGKEMRFGVLGSALFGTSSTLTSTGAVNSMHESYTALGGMMPMLNMMLGEVAPGGVGSGLYGMLVLALLTVFVGGLLVGRTPEYLGKKISSREIKLVSLYILVMPSLVLFGLALSFGIPPLRESVMEESMAASGHHGLSEMIYALISAANNNGSAFAGLTANTPWLAGLLGVVMLLGRFLPIILVLALAGSLARQETAPVTSGTLPTHRPLFAGMLLGVTVIVTALTFFPVLTLGPLSEGLK